MKQYLDAVREVLSKGTRKENRTGVDTISTFNINYEIDLAKGFPLLTTKEMSWKNIVIENLWFLSGRTDIKLLQKHGCKFWDVWADPVTGKVPSAYGNFWRQFPIHSSRTHDQGTSEEMTLTSPGFNDQIEWVLAELKRNPMSRRMVVSAWAPGNAQTSKLPPCHAMFILNVQNEVPQNVQQVSRETGQPVLNQTLNLHLTQRSCDMALGVPYNIAGYAFLLELFSRFSGIKAGIFAHTLIDAHAYTSKPDGSMAEFNHVHGLNMQLDRVPTALPKLHINQSIQNLSDIEALLEADTDTIMNNFVLEGYWPHPAIKFKVAV